MSIEEILGYAFGSLWSFGRSAFFALPLILGVLRLPPLCREMVHIPTGREQ
ncbi:MAG: hypothetical protein RML46_04795 [Anaerolineae bacterium]|nr:hypothetical protein [Anaerolineae bacterium]